MKNVIIVDFGFSGLSTVYYLGKAGCKVEVDEKNEWLFCNKNRVDANVKKSLSLRFIVCRRSADITEYNITFDGQKIEATKTAVIDTDIQSIINMLIIVSGGLDVKALFRFGFYHHLSFCLSGTPMCKHFLENG